MITQKNTAFAGIAILTLVLMTMLMGTQHTMASAMCATDLFFSEYIEGSGQNKALEVFNGTGAAVDLADYTIELYSNGNTTRQAELVLSGSLTDSDVIVVTSADSTVDAALQAAADFTSSVVNFNGNDVILLLKNGVVVDSIGQLGTDPGTEWGSGTTTTKEHTLVRMGTVTAGDTDETDLYDPTLEYVGSAQDDFSNIGTHAINCTGATATPVTPTAVPPTPVPNVSCTAAATAIHAIQGNGAASPLDGTTVVIEGVVVGDFQNADQLSGFFVQEQDADIDADPATSEGIFVYDDGFGVDVAVGDVVVVQGNVTEYYDLTEINAVTDVAICASGETVTPATAALPVTAATDLEAFEGMLVTMPQNLVVTELYNLARYGEISLGSDRLFNPTQQALPGAAAGAIATSNDLNRIILDDGSTQQNPAVVPHVADAGGVIRGGDVIANLTGVLNYSFGVYRVLPTQPLDITPNGRTATPDPVGGSLTVATMNVLNYFTTLDGNGSLCGPNGDQGCRGADSASEFTRQRTKILAALAAMNADMIGLIEIENNATASLQDLVDGLNALVGAGTYDFINSGTVGDDAIKVGFIYKTTTVTPVGSYAVLDSSVDATFIDDKNRAVLAQTFADMNGNTFTAAVNHLKSKGSDCDDLGDPDAGDGQGNCNLTRTQAAAALSAWLATDPTGSGDPDFLIMGDLNAYAMEDPIMTLKADGYVDLAEQFIGADRYSYVFDGEYGTLDYMMASSTFASQVSGATIWHLNSDEARYLDYNEEFNPASAYQPDQYRSSDHDPVIIGLSFDQLPTAVGLDTAGTTTSLPLLAISALLTVTAVTLLWRKQTAA